MYQIGYVRNDGTFVNVGSAGSESARNLVRVGYDSRLLANLALLRLRLSMRVPYYVFIQKSETS